MTVIEPTEHEAPLARERMRLGTERSHASRLGNQTLLTQTEQDKPLSNRSPSGHHPQVADIEPVSFDACDKCGRFGCNGCTGNPYRERSFLGAQDIALVDVRTATEVICDVCFQIRPRHLVAGTTCVDCT